MGQRRRHPDVPATLRELYPLARRRGSVQLFWKHRVSISPLQILLGIPVALLALIAATLTAPILIPAAVIIGIPLVIIEALLLTRGTSAGWQRWASARMVLAIDEVPSIAPLEWFGGRPRRRAGWHGVAGARQIDVQYGLADVRRLDEHDEVLYARIALPPAVASVFPKLIVSRRSGTAASHYGHTVTRLDLESIELSKLVSIRAARDTDELKLRQLFDPVLIDLLMSGLAAELIIEDGDLLVIVPADHDAVEHPDEDRLDTLTVMAVAIESRLARVVGNGRSLEPVRLPRPHDAIVRGRKTKHLTSSRQRDLDMGPEQLFAELAKYTTAEEVELVRARIDSGDFPLSSLDDLVHHRRARLWGEDSDAAA